MQSAVTLESVTQLRPICRGFVAKSAYFNVSASSAQEERDWTFVKTDSAVRADTEFLFIHNTVD